MSLFFEIFLSVIIIFIGFYICVGRQQDNIYWKVKWMNTEGYWKEKWIELKKDKAKDLYFEHKCQIFRISFAKYISNIQEIQEDMLGAIRKVEDHEIKEVLYRNHNLFKSHHDLLQKFLETHSNEIDNKKEW